MQELWCDIHLQERENAKGYNLHMRLQPVQRVEIRINMKVFNKIKPFILASIISCSNVAQADKNTKAVSELEGILDSNTIATMTYDRNHVIASTKEGGYERFERKGYDQTKYCMQIFYLPSSTEVIQVIDGIDGVCDDKIEAYTFNYKGENITYFCDDKLIPENPCDNVNSLIMIFKIRNGIDLIKKEWDNHRESCSERECSLVLEGKSRSLSKKSTRR